MARLVKRTDGGLKTVAAIPPHLVGKVESEAELKAALAKEKESNAAKGSAEPGETPVPEELSKLSGDALAERFEAEFGRKPGNRTEDTQREEIAAKLAEE